jgi:hypothetical protein
MWQMKKGVTGTHDSNLSAENRLTKTSGFVVARIARLELPPNSPSLHVPLSFLGTH